jgi:hypothetical protein
MIATSSGSALIARSVGNGLRVQEERWTPIMADQAAFSELDIKHQQNIALIRTLGADHPDDVAALFVECQLLQTAMRAMARKYNSQIAERN